MSVSRDAVYILCDFPSCEQSVKNHRWGVTKASGWFFTRKTDEAWCPDHLPDWVPGWKARNQGV